MTDSGNEEKESQVDKDAQTISNEFLIMYLSNVTKCSHNILINLSKCTDVIYLWYFSQTALQNKIV